MLESHLMEQVTSVNLGLQRSVRHGAVISQSPRAPEPLHISRRFPSLLDPGSGRPGPPSWPPPALRGFDAEGHGPSDSKSVVVGTAFLASPFLHLFFAFCFRGFSCDLRILTVV